MAHYATLIYGPGSDDIRMLFGDDEAIRLNLIEYTSEPGVEARNLSNTALSNLSGSALRTFGELNPAIPPTVAEFDAQYPNCEFDDDFLNPPE